MAYVSYDGRCLFILDHTISYTCICNYSSIILTVPGTIDKDILNGSRWTCGSQSNVSNPVTLYVDSNIIPITKVNLTSTLSDENPIKVVSGSKHEFICTTDASRPAARIQWYLSGTNITDEASAQPSICSAGCETVISSSILSYIGNITDNGKTMYCTAVNVEGQSVNSTMKSIDILYQPIISGIPDYNVTEGNTLSIFPIIDANPQPTLFWWSRGGENDVVYNSFNLTIRNIKRNFSGNYTFLVSNTLKPSGMPSEELKSRKMFHVNVQYQPFFLEMEDHNVTEGNDLQIYPVIDANPQPTMLWWTRQNDFIYYGSNLTIKNIQRNSSGNYTCLVMNTLTPSGKSPQNRTSQKMFYVNVQYHPAVSDIPDYNVTEGNTLGIFPIIDANPQPTLLWWSRRDENDVVYKGFNLTISNIQRNYSGNYTLLVRNTLTPSGMPSQERTSKTMFHVNVQYQPVISEIQDYNITEGNDLKIYPVIDANPQPTMLRWSRHNDFIHYGSNLTITNIQRNLSGNYTCHVMNILTPSGKSSENRTSKKMFYVNVSVNQPMIAEINDINITEGSNLAIYPVIDANPQSTSVWWSRQSEPDFRFYDTNFTISNIQRKSTGSYIFNAVNILAPSGMPPQKRTSQKMCYVNVQYKAVLSGSPDYNIEEGSTLTLSPTIDANPSPTYIWWTLSTGPSAQDTSDNSVIIGAGFGSGLFASL
ncbi:unnamed protein product [Mytilus edulis]|uniref:Ig-like domain-containing protein n=1 Tax=Mytilus edulis TaxID=6550 RepID=A0A8S3RJA4_MYTED|nr:unnamed protein product [Mytilus edulis]